MSMFSDQFDKIMAEQDRAVEADDEAAFWAAEREFEKLLENAAHIVRAEALAEVHGIRTVQ
jgi:hypothetical protein